MRKERRPQKRNGQIDPDQVLDAAKNFERLFSLIEQITELISAGQIVGLRARCVVAHALWIAHERVMQDVATKRERNARAASNAAMEAMLSAGAKGRSIRTLRKLLTQMLDAVESGKR